MIDMEPTWLSRLEGEFSQAYMQSLKAFLVERKAQGATIFPRGSHYFNAFRLTPFDQVKIVIIGQDPYHGPNQAHGLSFSVPVGVATPPSLQNMYKELAEDVGFVDPGHGCLSYWAEQGVLLLNSVLTVEQGKAGAHQGKGWEQFTDQAIAKLSVEREGIVFLLWGSYAQKKGQLIDNQRHFVLKAPHPSPLSAYRGFFGCKHFSRANHYLQQRGEVPINWQLPVAS